MRSWRGGESGAGGCRAALGGSGAGGAAAGSRAREEDAAAGARGGVGGGLCRSRGHAAQGRRAMELESRSMDLVTRYEILISVDQP